MFALRHKKEAIYRGSGGAPSATDSITLNQLIGLEAAASQSATNAAASETAAQAAQTAAELAETNAEAAQLAAETAQSGAETAESNSELAQAAAEAAQLAAETVYDSFDDRYLGAKASEPTLDNDGDPLVTGALYFNTTNFIMYVYTGAAWQNMWDTQEAIDFSLAPTTSVQIGRLQWNATEQTLDLGITNDVTLQIGREMHVRVRNESGSLLTNGTLVYVTGSTGNNLTVEVADNTSLTTSTGVLAMVTEDIPNNSEGKVTSFGVVRDVNTLAFSEGDKLYLGTSGAFTNVKPTYPNFAVPIGYVVRSSATVGSIFIRIESHISFNEINNLDIGTPATGDLVSYDGTKWTKQSQGTGNGLDSDTVDGYEAAELFNISGLVPSNAADADHDITISTGRAVDSTGAKVLSLTSTITKQIDATWAAGNNLGGLFTGTVAADTTYHLFIIEKDSDGSIDAGFDTSLTAANIPAGYTKYRRVASFITNASANLYLVDSKEVEGGSLLLSYVTRITDISDTSPGTTANVTALSVPTDIVTEAYLNAKLNEGTGNTRVIVNAIFETDVAASITNNTLRTSSAGPNSVNDFTILTSTAGTIRYRSDNATVTQLDILLKAYKDFRRN